MPSNRSVLHDIEEKNLKPHKAYKTGKDGTLTVAGKPIVEIAPEPVVVEPEVFGKARQVEVNVEPPVLEQPTQEVVEEVATFQKEEESSDPTSVVAEMPSPKKRFKKNSVDL